MPMKQDSRSFLLWLSLTTVVLAVGLAIMTAVFLRQSQSAETTARLQADSVTALTFQLEREFLRFRNELNLALSGSAAPDWEVLQVRYDILVSRVSLLRDNPSTVKLQDRDEYTQLLPELQALVAQTSPWMDAPTSGPRA
jgi:two-component system, sensor histidine kinase